MKSASTEFVPAQYLYIENDFWKGISQETKNALFFKRACHKSNVPAKIPNLLLCLLGIEVEFPTPDSGLKNYNIREEMASYRHKPGQLHY